MDWAAGCAAAAGWLAGVQMPLLCPRHPCVPLRACLPPASADADDWATLIENVVDCGHVPFTHHGERAALGVQPAWTQQLQAAWQCRGAGIDPRPPCCHRLPAGSVSKRQSSGIFDDMKASREQLHGSCAWSSHAESRFRHRAAVDGSLSRAAPSLPRPAVACCAGAGARPVWFPGGVAHR